MQNLTELNLHDTKITDEGLKELAKLQELEVLGLTNTQITDAGLKEVEDAEARTALLAQHPNHRRGPHGTSGQVAGFSLIDQFTFKDVAELKGYAELHNLRPLILPVKLLQRVGEPPKGLDG